ncbi:ribonuclease HII [Otoolea muris]|uniref:ribonuclease HII n=1 Tax=Otoolea muris TaxID=2941515 RepID=UPI00203CAC65|nr:ribonuclease HII [Otoolea muris]
MRTWKGEALLKELARLETMKEYERLYADDACICGIDEAGRGPLAGPVVAAAVVLPKECGILGLNDSKKLSPARREALYKEIREKAVSFGVGVVSPGVIDEINILQATYEAMRQAVSALTVSPDRFLNDAVVIPGIEAERQVSIVKGDAKSVSIAAASILAKVERDHMMEAYDGLYPQYGFARHKGYGTKAHMEAIRAFGMCPIHRRTFLKKMGVKA